MEKIQNIVAEAEEPGILVILSGGEKGWMDDEEFAELVKSAHFKQWETEILVWNNSTRVGDLFSEIEGRTTRRRGCVTFLENLYYHLF